MSRPKRIFVPGSCYHIYNRVLNNEILFLQQANYFYCLNLIKKYMEKYKVGVLAYCLMPNHYHFLLRQLSTTSLSQFIASVFNPYIQKINRQVGRRGPLFAGRFKDVHVDREEYLVHLCRYIHLNPVVAGLVEHPEEWPYSNYLEWIGERDGALQDWEFIDGIFSTKLAYKDFVDEYLVEDQLREQLDKFTFD